jgi:hypothetical protein
MFISPLIPAFSLKGEGASTCIDTYAPEGGGSKMSKLFHARSLPSFRQLPRQTCKAPAPVFKSSGARANAIVIKLSLVDTVFL